MAVKKSVTRKDNKLPTAGFLVALIVIVILFFFAKVAFYLALAALVIVGTVYLYRNMPDKKTDTVDSSTTSK